MRKPLSPLKAFAEDARAGIERAFDDGDALVSWLSLAQAADSLIDLQGEDRVAALSYAQQLLTPFATDRPTMVHDARPAPTEEIDIVAEQFRVAAEAMENAGCFELAYSTVSAVCRLTAGSNYVSSALATTHLGRIARQMNDLSTAEDCYATMLQTSTRKRDGPLAARGHIGLALIHDMRGNLPAAEAEYLKALDLTVHGGSTYTSACQGLMTLAITGSRLADALIYGWRGYDAAPPGSAVQVEFLTDLSVIAMHAGFHEAALNGFEQALMKPMVPRIQMITLSGAARVSALLGNHNRVRQYDTELLREIELANQPMLASLALIGAAEAWHTLHEFELARDRVMRSLAISETNGFNEQLFKAEELRNSIDRDANSAHVVVAKVSDDSLSSARSNRFVDTGIRRLEVLGV